MVIFNPFIILITIVTYVITKITMPNHSFEKCSVQQNRAADDSAMVDQIAYQTQPVALTVGQWFIDNVYSEMNENFEIHFQMNMI